MTDPLDRYRAKRDFRVTPEPPGVLSRSGKRLRFVVQEHHARRVHYDFRIELDGVLKSWAVPKGLSDRAGERRMAVQTEDHPLSYADFEGTIPPRHYGAGEMTIWDSGEWAPIGDPRHGLERGKLKLALRGQRLHGVWNLIRMRGRDAESGRSWLLVRETSPEPAAMPRAKSGAKSAARPATGSKAPAATSTARHGLRDDKPAEAIRREQPVPARAAGVGLAIAITHPDRSIDAPGGLAKIDLVRYYEQVAEYMLPHLAGRPVSLLRAPGGLQGKQFFQKHGERARIPGVRILDASLDSGRQSLLQIDTVDALLGAAQMNAIELHVWNAKSRTIERPDRMIFDLDPGDGTGWAEVVEGAQLTRALLDELGLECFVKTSGSKGLHVVVPIAAHHDWETVRTFSQSVVRHMARLIPARFVASPGAARRVGRIFIDYLRNGRGATTVAAFSARARTGLPVSMPVGWDELATVGSSDQWTIRDAVARVAAQRADPWAGIHASRQALAKPIERLTAAAGSPGRRR